MNALVSVFLRSCWAALRRSVSSLRPLGVQVGLCLLLAAQCLALRAQQEATFGLFWQGQTQWNPAAAGQSEQLSVLGKMQTHAAGFQDAGSTMWLGVDLGVSWAGIQQGVGASFTKDAIGLFAHQQFALQYALHQKLWGGTLSLGLQANMLQEGLSGSRADLEQSNDPAFPSTDVKGSAFDFAAGVAYRRGALSLGLSATKLTAPEIRLAESYQLRYRPHYNVAASYNIRTRSPFLVIIPAVMWRSDWADHRFDLSARAEYRYEKRHLFGGVNYAPQRSVGAFVGGVVRGVALTYGYEAFTSALGLGAGQHEISVAYRLDLNLRKPKRNRHKSVRWL